MLFKYVMVVKIRCDLRVNYRSQNIRAKYASLMYFTYRKREREGVRERERLFGLLHNYLEPSRTDDVKLQGLSL